MLPEAGSTTGYVCQLPIQSAILSLSTASLIVDLISKLFNVMSKHTEEHSGEGGGIDVHNKF